MTLVNGTVQDLGYDGMEGTLWARPARFRSDGSVVYAPERKPYKITDGVVSAELAPGPAVLELQVGSHARGTFEVVIPEEDTTLADLLDTVFPWEPEQVSVFVAARDAAEQAKADAELAAQQAGQDRAHVDQVRALLDETYDESQAGMALPPRLMESELNATYGTKAELAEKASTAEAARLGRVGATGSSLLSALSQPVTGVTLERVTAAKYYLYSDLPGSRRIRWTLEETSSSRPGKVHQIKEVHALYTKDDTALQTTIVDERDNATITWSGTWSNVGYGTPITGMHGGSTRRTVTEGSYAEWTTPPASALGVLSTRSSNTGIAKVTVDGSSTNANLLPTAQDLVNTGSLASSALVANGGTLNPTDRVIDFFDPATTYAWEVPIAEGLAETAHTVRITSTGYKNPTSTDVRVEVDAYTYGVVTGGPVTTVEQLHGTGSVWEYAFQINAGTQTQWIGNDHGYDHQTSIAFTVDGAPAILSNGQSVSGSEIVVTRKSGLSHPDLGGTAGGAGEVTCEWRLKGDALTITFAWTPAFSSASGSNKLEYPMAGVSSSTAEGFTKGRTLAMDTDQDLSNHDGNTPGQGTVSDTILLWQPEGNLALIVHVPDTKRTFADHDMSVYLQDRAQDASRPDLYMSKGYFEHLAVPIVSGKTIRGQGVYRFALMPNPDLALAL